MNVIHFLSRFLDQVAANKAEKFDKHRFLVQSKIIDKANI